VPSPTAPNKPNLRGTGEPALRTTRTQSHAGRAKRSQFPRFGGGSAGGYEKQSQLAWSGPQRGLGLRGAHRGAIIPLLKTN